MSKVEHQGSCNSCWAYATTDVVEAMYNIKNNKMGQKIGGQGNEDGLELAVMQLVNCYGRPGVGCAYGGWPDKALDYIIDNSILSESSFKNTLNGCLLNYPYDSYSIESYKSASGTNKIKIALQNGPVTAVLQWNNQIWEKGGQGDVLMRCESSASALHAVVIIGYDDDKGVWIIKNSNGGDNGIQQVKYGVCGIDTKYTTYSVKI